MAVPSPPPPAPPGVTIPAPPPPPPGVPTSAPAPSSSQLVLSPTGVPLRSLEPFKLPFIKDAKAYLDVHDIIQYYLRQPEYATQRSDNALVTTPSNVAASLFWEGQIWNAVCEGSLCFLFDNKGTLYHSKGFEMLAVLDQHCHPDTIVNAFSMLMSLFNNVQGLSESILEFCSQFDGMVLEMSRSKIFLPRIFLVMLFLRALHFRYSDILDQFRSRYKTLETATIKSIVEDACYHDEFKLVGSNKKGGPTPKAANANVDRRSKEWGSPFEWLSACSLKGIKTRWDRAIAGTGICPICHRAEKPWHVPAKCPLLKELNLKLVTGPPSLAPGPAPTPPPAPAPVAPTPFPSPGGRVASTDDQSISKSVGSPSAPSGLMALVAEDDFDSDQEFHWTEDDDGFKYSPSISSSSRKSNTQVAPYPSCFQVSLMSSSPSSVSVEIFIPSASRSSSTAELCSPHSISTALQSLIQRLSHSSISPD